MRRRAAALLPVLAVLLGGAAPGPAPETLSGGATTVFATGQNAFSFPAANLGDAERTRFAIGNSFFKRNWVEAPASTTARDGLGPHFIARSCGGCHALDGRGTPALGLLLRLSVPGTDVHGGPKPEPTYGDQLNTEAVQGVKPEGRLVVRHEALVLRLADGTRHTLRRPVYTIAEPGHGPLDAGTLTSPRIAPQLIGVGLLEAIPAAELERVAAEQAAAPGPVKGRVNQVWDAPSGRMMPGRFGWKANVATLLHQTAGAFRGDIGITSPIFPDEACMPAQADCRAAPHGGRPEIDARTLADVVFYQATLAPPARRRVDDPQVRRGEALFARAQCSACHRPSWTTGPLAASPALAGQTIRPYTDLLLHDLGEALADGRPDFRAGGRDWRTPPLWGIGLLHDVNAHQRLLHDGRADGVLEAILWHGGEAEAAKQQVLTMSLAERRALVAFVESL